MTDRKHFGAFVLEAAKLKLEKAQAVAIYIQKRTDKPHDASEMMKRAYMIGEIRRDRYETLLALLEECKREHDANGRIIDRRTDKDWEDLGNGARRKRAILEGMQD